MKKKEDNLIRPYGDTLDDGRVQLAFSLPVDSGRAAEAARQLARKMGLQEAQCVYEKSMGEGFTFVIVYGRCVHAVDVSHLQKDHEPEEAMGMDDVNAYIREHVGRKLVVVGACIESDAHTVGIDAMLNMKGYDGHYGLERYSMFAVKNLGAQVPCQELIRQARMCHADAILVSQVVTQNNVHLHHLTRLVELLESERVRERYLLVVGGPFITNRFARELGYDRGFGRGTMPSDLATFLARRMAERIEQDKGTGKSKK